ncbi:MAG: DUF1822 family protein [Cyanobacteria bacterium RM1_2_2]|nr:DUF1822 family protein [Cyanobacteria bacterium RM1_2_2]
MFAFADPTELWREVSPSRATAGQRAASSAANRWNAGLNQICLELLLESIRADHAPDAVSWLSEGQIPSVWEFVNGSAITIGTTIGTTRLALMPTEAIDDSEFVVPQEWVDIPSWIADYYLAVQVQIEPDAEQSWIRVWGYATHADLKTSGRYDADDRTYSLEPAQLTRDWSALWVTLRFCPDAATRATVAPLPELPTPQAESLMQRLSQPTVTFPRLSIPFTTWGALLQSEWRQQLYQRRIQADANPSSPIHLSQWFQQVQQQVTAGWQRLETLLGTDAPLAASLRSVNDQPNTITQAKLLEVAGQAVVLVMHLSPEADERMAILVQLHPAANPALVPANLNLSLLADTGETLQSVQAGSQDNYIQLRRFRCPEGTPFQVQIELDAEQVTEAFLA